MSGGASMPPMSGGASSSMPSMPPLSSFGLDSNSLFSLGDGPTDGPTDGPSDGPTEAPAVNIELTAKVAPVTAAAAPIPSWVPKAGTILTQYPRAPIGTYDINGYKRAAPAYAASYAAPSYAGAATYTGAATYADAATYAAPYAPSSNTYNYNTGFGGYGAYNSAPYSFGTSYGGFGASAYGGGFGGYSTVGAAGTFFGR